METVSHVLFYGHTKPFGELSNFYPSPFVVNGHKYICSEHYFMKMKQEAFDPHNSRLAEEILTSTKPATIKALGRKVANFNEATWAQVRFGHMVNALIHKFTQNSDLRARLLGTGSKVLVEAAPKDAIWGAGASAEQIIRSAGAYSGQNLLGKALMQVRATLGTKWAVYVRTSGSAGLTGDELERDIQAELERQRTACASYAAHSSLQPVQGTWAFEDRCYGDMPLDERPGLRNLIQSGATGIICTDRARFGPGALDPQGWLNAHRLVFKALDG